MKEKEGQEEEDKVKKLWRQEGSVDTPHGVLYFTERRRRIRT